MEEIIKTFREQFLAQFIALIVFFAFPAIQFSR